MAVLTIEWNGKWTPPSTGTVTGGGSEVQEPAPAEKPMLVWIQDPEDEEADQKIARVVLDPDKLRVACAYFSCIKVSAEVAAEDAILSDAGKKLPRMVLITRDWDVAKVLEGKISSSKLYGAMKKAASKSYKGNFDKNVKSVIKILGELDKIANEKERIADKEKDAKPAEAKKLAKQLSEIEEHEKEVLEKRTELLNPELKAA
jgi:hypothetical protein